MKEISYVSQLTGFFYNSNFGYNWKFHSKELGNYKITYVFSRLARRVFKVFRASSAIPIKPRVKSVAFNKSDYQIPSGIWKSPAANWLVNVISMQWKQAERLEKRFVDCFYNFKFYYYGKFHSKELGNYKIKIVFLVWFLD